MQARSRSGVLVIARGSPSAANRHLAFGSRAGASLIVTVSFWLTILSLSSAASVSADGPVDGKNAPHHGRTDEHWGAYVAPRGSGTAAHSPGLPASREPPPPLDSRVSPTRDELSVPWPEFGPGAIFEPGHDKCKKWRGTRCHCSASV
jgi:hypothetical protein